MLDVVLSFVIAAGRCWGTTGTGCWSSVDSGIVRDSMGSGDLGLRAGRGGIEGAPGDFARTGRGGIDGRPLDCELAMMDGRCACS